MKDRKNIRSLFDATVHDAEGEKLGSVNEVFVDDTTGQPTFIEVNHGLFGLASSVIPLRGSQLTDNTLTLAFPKDTIKDAPGVDTDNGLTPDQQNEVYAHYGLESATDVDVYETEPGFTASADPDPDRGVDPSERERTQGHRIVDEQEPRATDVPRDDQRGRHTPQEVPSTTNSPDESRADEELVRSEEHLEVDKDRVESGRVRLRKYVVTDTETVEVPVSHEEVVIERTPVNETEADRLSDQTIGEDEAEVTLHEERVDVTTRTEPVEKVSLGKKEVTENERLTGEVDREEFEIDGLNDADDRLTGRDR